jgi:adenosylhomocysteine nucleosidase
MKVDIGIIGAMEEEVSALVGMLEKAKRERVGMIDFYVGNIHKKKVVIAKCGVGKVFAAVCAEAMILNYSPRLIVNTGVGGALGAGITTTNVVIADKLCQHDMDTSAIGDPKGLVSGINKIYFDADPRAIRILDKAARELSVKTFIGTVATGDKFIADPIDKARIVSDFSAICCEMEGGAIAQVAHVNLVPFAVVRAISDSADGEATMDFPTFLPIAAKNSTAMTLALIKEY